MKHSLVSFAKAARNGFALLALCILASTPANAADTSQYIDLTRYTIVDDNTFWYDTGYLHLDGTFHLIASSTEYYDVWGLSRNDIAPFSGKPMMSEEAFAASQSAGLIPHWIRSRDAYWIGYDNYVAVAVKGKGDPNPSITIYMQPWNQAAAIGDRIAFAVGASSPGNIAYQWQHKGKALPGQTDWMLTITNVTAADAGIYRASLTTGSKPILSKPALLKIDKPVVIKTEPKSLAVKAGKPAVFRVALSGSAPFGYQWYFNGQSITNATKSFYAIPHAESANSGDYCVLVQNPVSKAYSTNATLTVTP